MKDDGKIVTFVAFCIECYKTIHGVSGHGVGDAEVLERTIVGRKMV